MKKTLKIIAIIAIMLVAVFALTGCGNKLVATKDVEGTESEPKHSEKIEISFKDDKVSLPTMEQKGKKAIMEMDAKMYSEMSGETEAGMTKDEVKASLEKEGYKVK